MTPAAFLRTEEVSRAIERAARCAGMPVSVHVRQGDRWVLVAGSGQCAACAHVAKLDRGKKACEKSRGTAASAALQAQMGRPFICHAGFACLTVPCAAGAAITFGPYCPAEESQSLAADFLEGLAALGHTVDETPVLLQDIHRIPASAVPALAAWTVQELAALWERLEEGCADASSDTDTEGSAKRARRRLATKSDSAREPHGFGAIAAALAGGATGKARALVQAALAETSGTRKTSISVKRCRALVLAAGVLESAARASLPVDACWARMDGFVQDARQARSEAQLINAVIKLLAPLKRTKPQPVQNQSYAELNEILLENLDRPITLAEVARRLGQQPTAITHRLQRNFGMSFSDYIGRLRIDRAKELLRRTKLTIEAVGRRVGIEDASNFRKLFRKFEPVSPQEYRDQFRGKK